MSTGETVKENSAIPYLSFETFKNFVDGLSSGRPLPPRIDRSLMAGMAGGTQTLLLGALETFGLIGENKEVTPRFIELVRLSSDERPRYMAALVREHYADQMALAQEHATAEQLAESFRAMSGYQGSTLRKAITFFLNMARYAEVPLSPYFRAPRQTSPQRVRSPRRAVPREAVPPQPEPTDTRGEATSTPSGETRSVSLRSGGTVTVSCSTTFLALTREDRMFVFDLVDRLLEYEEKSAAETATTEAAV